MSDGTQMQSLVEFLDKWSQRGASVKVLRTRLFDAYSLFCVLGGKQCPTPERFAASLEELDLSFDEPYVMGVDLSNDFTAWALAAAQEYEARKVRGTE